MTPFARVHAALKGEKTDRPPLCFWHHFQPEGSGKRLAEMSVDFFVTKFDLDIIKIMPDLPYPMPEKPYTFPEQIRDLPPLDMDTPSFREQLICIKAIRNRVGIDRPIVLTVFSPLTQIMRFVGKLKAIEEIRKNPEPFKIGMRTITDNLQIFMRSAIAAGASGIYFSCMGATTAHFTPQEYKELALPFDLDCLKSAQKGWLNIVHIHADPEQKNDKIFFDIFADYPVQVLSWSDKLTGPSLKEALKQTKKILMSGLYERGPLVYGNEKALSEEITGAIDQTAGKRLILANGCSIPNDTPEKYLHSARNIINHITI